MSISATESIQSVRMLDEKHSYESRRERLEADMASEFTRAIEAGEPDATPAWTGVVIDYDKARELGIRFTDPRVPLRSSTVAETLRDALDYTNGPDMSDVLKVLSMAMKSTDKSVSDAARDLVKRAAFKWAEMNAEMDE